MQQVRAALILKLPSLGSSLPPPPPPQPQQPTHLCHLHAEDIPAGVTHCAVLWERGDKIQYVDPLEVDPGSSSVQFRHVMRQVRSSF